MRHLIFLFALALPLAGSLAGSVHAQAAPVHERFWLTGGVGFASSTRIAASLLLAERTGRSGLVALRGTSQQEFALFQDALEHEWEVGLLFGRVKQHRYGLAAVSLGAAAVGGMQRGAFIRTEGPDPDECGSFFAIVCALLREDVYDEDRYVTVGLPIDVQMFWTPSRRLGLGVRAYANLNPLHSFAGLNVHVVVGRLR